MLALANKLSLNTQPIYRFVNKYSIDFDGVDDRIVTDGADTVAQPTTYSFWCKASETGQNKGVFGHGGSNRGAFHFNWSSNRPLLYLGGNYFVYWNDNSAQDDGEWHHWVVYSDPNNLNNCKLYVDGVLQTVNTTESSGSLNAYTESLTIGSDNQVGGNSFEGQIDEFAVYDRELTQAEITRMYNTYYSPNRVANGNFAQIGNEEVTNGDFSQIGSEQVTNGDFDSGSNWSTPTGWEIIDGKLKGTNVNAVSSTQGGHTFLNKSFKVVYTVSDYVQGDVRIYLGGTQQTPNRSANGTYTEYITITTANTTLYIQGINNFTGSIDNISIKEVGQDWSFNTGWSMGDGKALALAVNGDSLQQSVSLDNTKIYQIQFEISDYVEGEVRVRFAGGGIAVSTAYASGNNTHTLYLQSTGNTLLRLQGQNDFTGSIDNISVKEVGQHWTLNGTATISDGKAHINSPSGELAEITQTGSLVIGRNYRLTCDLDKTSGDTQFVNGGTFILVDGFNTINFTANSTNVYFKRGAGSVISSLDNIVVQELKHDATNLMLNAGAYQSANPLITSTKSMEFDGTDDYLQLSEPFSYTNHTITGWFKLNINNATISIFDTRDSGNDGIVVYIDTGGQLTYRVGDGSGSTINSSSLDINKWYNFACTYDGTTQTLYLDGVNVSNTTTSKTISTTTNAAIGKSTYVDSIYFNGQITEVGAYNRALTALEVASLYNQGVPTDLLVSRGDYVATNLVGYWKMGDGTNDEYPVIYDQTNPTNSADVYDNDIDEAVNGGGWTDNGDGTFTVTGTGIVSTGIGVRDTNASYLTQGKVYKWTVDGDNTTLAVYNSGFGLEASGTSPLYFTATSQNRLYISPTNGITSTYSNVLIKEVQGNSAYMTNMVEGNITNQYPLTKIRNYYRMGDGILDGYPIIQDQTSPNLAHIPTTNLLPYSEDFSQWTATDCSITSGFTAPDGSNTAYKVSDNGAPNGLLYYSGVSAADQARTIYARTVSGTGTAQLTSFNGNTNNIFNLTEDWQRFEVNTTTDVATIFYAIDFRGSGTLSEVLLWGAQTEEQSQATAYIKSDGIAAVRKSSTTNLIEYSEDFSQSSWANSNISASISNVLSPDGTSYSYKLTNNAVSGNHFLRDTITVTNGLPYTLSVFIKKGTRDIVSISDGFNVNVLASFDLTNGTVTNASATSSSIESHNNDWFKCIATMTPSSTTLGFMIMSGTVYAGTDESGDFYVWAAQVEQQTQAEKYAKTTGLPVTIDLFTENNYGTMTNMSASDIVEDTP